jgi:hypothetical protein
MRGFCDGGSGEACAENRRKETVKSRCVVCMIDFCRNREISSLFKFA